MPHLIKSGDEFLIILNYYDDLFLCAKVNYVNVLSVKNYHEEIRYQEDSTELNVHKSKWYTFLQFVPHSFFDNNLLTIKFSS